VISVRTARLRAERADRSGDRAASALASDALWEARRAALAGPGALPAHVTGLGGDWITVVDGAGRLIATGRRAFRGGYHVKMTVGSLRGATMECVADERVLDLALAWAS
jgi:hypothetical protein